MTPKKPRPASAKNFELKQFELKQKEKLPKQTIGVQVPRTPQAKRDSDVVSEKVQTRSERSADSRPVKPKARILNVNSSMPESEFILPAAKNMLLVDRILSIVGGSALAVYGLRRRSFRGAVFSFIGGALIYRGLHGHSHMYKILAKDGFLWSPKEESLVIEGTIVVNASPSAVYSFIQNPEHLLALFGPAIQVTFLDDGRLNWIVPVGPNKEIEFTSERVADVKDRLLSWRSFPDASVSHEGAIYIHPEKSGGTEVKVMLKYDPPVPLPVRRLFGHNPEAELRRKLEKIKTEIECI